MDSVKRTWRIEEKGVVKSPGWCNYVFDNDYNLMLLDSLELYIKANKYLPDIPTGTEVSKNGINVDNMNAELLQKVEKLTFYVISLWLNRKKTLKP